MGLSHSSDAVGGNHLQLVHPPTLAVGSAVFAMLFVIAWRLPRAPGPLIAMILAGGCVALFDLASNGIQTVGAVRVVWRCQPCPA
jgi:sulfate permease, SulP family